MEGKREREAGLVKNVSKVISREGRSVSMMAVITTHDSMTDSHPYGNSVDGDTPLTSGQGLRSP